MSKTKETLSFYYKTQTRITKGTRLELDLGKMMVYCCCSCWSRAPPKERKERKLSSCFGEKNEMKCVVIDIYISHKDKIHNLWK